ncbi:MAG TPA: iron donor protein CyaY [Bryobacteraceae bacterium]|nr:iron donor protein CyaY [Bryobacteraceae bacterium]
MEDQEFQKRADDALTRLYSRLVAASEDAGFEPEFQAGALSVEFDNPPGRFVISPNSPVRQVWVSAHSRSFKLDWDDAHSAFVLRDTGQTLTDLIESAIGQQLGEEIRL